MKEVNILTRDIGCGVTSIYWSCILVGNQEHSYWSWFILMQNLLAPFLVAKKDVEISD